MEINNNSETLYPEKDTNILTRPPSMHTTLRTPFSSIIYIRNYNVISIWSLYNDAANISDYTPYNNQITVKSVCKDNGWKATTEFGVLSEH